MGFSNNSGLRGIVKKPKDARENQPMRYRNETNSDLSPFPENSLTRGIDPWEPGGISRRRFLSLLSASAALAMGASCSRIDRGSIVPYSKQPGEIIPGVATYYASTFQEGWNVQGVLVKTREGRPIHIEGNPDHPVSQGTVSLRAMGDLLGLYDPDRLRAPSLKGASKTWEEAEEAISQALKKGRLGDKPILLMTGTIMSPSQKALIGDLKGVVPGLQHVSWEPCVPDGQFPAASKLFDVPAIPTLHLERAEVIVSLQSDFLGMDNTTPVSLRDFAAQRRLAAPEDRMNRLWVFEGSMTLTGANADERVRVKPSGLASLAFSLIRILNEIEGIPLPVELRREDLKAFEPTQTAAGLGVETATLKLVAADLAQARKKTIVLCGPSLSQDAHIACHLLNMMVESEGNTIDYDNRSWIPEALSNTALKELFEDAIDGKFAAGIFWNVNPAYAFPKTSLWKKAKENMADTFRIGLYADETAQDCNWQLPENHWLESWGDFQSAPDYINLRQPTIGALHDTRQGEDIFLSCIRRMNLPAPADYHEYIRNRWEARVYPETSPVAFQDYWNAALHNGGAPCIPESEPRKTVRAEALQQAMESAAARTGTGNANAMEVVLSPGSGIYDGRYANNGWLIEFPDPVSKATWENPVALSVPDAERLGLESGDMVEVSNGTESIEAPVLVQPGQCKGVASIALGYGRRTGSVASGIGVNAYPLLKVSPGSCLIVSEASVRRSVSSKKRPIPLTQTHDRMEGRDPVLSWTLTQYSENAGGHKTSESHTHVSLIPEQKFPGHKWGMAVDLSACVGCGACVIACQSENNIPVVGPERILQGRHMHWIRVDRYYEGDPQEPRVLHQPMFCQHCDNAPCEIVCPVNATTHSPDGLNQMAYNRCVGTRYCSNNCPFKVRRFNFFDYTSMKKEPENLVFNPEVTVRPRGVMEKCTFCIQRIENAKQKAKVEDRPIKDGEIRPACASACPTNAIVFGDLNDAQSRVSKMVTLDRHYRVFEELGIGPSVVYLADISNPAAEKESV
jgi:Fe-S-cluster-containing dehydrogenase component/anaerobic selenocysteine-containing dehydrogenase